MSGIYVNNGKNKEANLKYRAETVPALRKLSSLAETSSILISHHIFSLEIFMISKSQQRNKYT